MAEFTQFALSGPSIFCVSLCSYQIMSSTVCAGTLPSSFRAFSYPGPSALCTYSEHSLSQPFLGKGLLRCRLAVPPHQASRLSLRALYPCILSVGGPFFRELWSREGVLASFDGDRHSWLETDPGLGSPWHHLWAIIKHTPLLPPLRTGGRGAES